MNQKVKNAKRHKYGMESNNHAVFTLHYHLIIVTKYRRKIITPEIAEYINKRATEIGETYHITPQEFGYEPDHIHLLFKAWPNSNIPRFINSFKASTSRNIRKNYPEVKNKIWKNVFWSPSYCLTTTGGAPLEKLERYIKNQGQQEHSR